MDIAVDPQRICAWFPIHNEHPGISIRAPNKPEHVHLPDFRAYAVAVPSPGVTRAESTRAIGVFLRDMMRDNLDNFRVFSPDETTSNRLGALLEVTSRAWMVERLDSEDHLAADGPVMEMLSEHACQGWLEGHLLSRRRGLFSCCEAFIHTIDSMFNQHAKWLEVCAGIAWRRPIASLNILLYVTERCLRSRNLVNVIVAGKQPELQWLDGGP